MITPEQLRVHLAAVRAALARGDIGDAMFVLEQLERDVENAEPEPESEPEPKPEPVIRWGRA